MLTPVAAVIAARAPLASAQVPAVSIELTTGSGVHTHRTSTIYYMPYKTDMYRLATTIRVGTAGAVRPVLTLERSDSCFPLDTCDYVTPTICIFAPTGSCEQEFPRPDGTAAAIGLAGAWSRYVVATIEGGKGWYQHRARYIDANVALNIIPHVALTGDARQIFSTADDGDKTWYFPRSFGVRLYY